MALQSLKCKPCEIGQPPLPASETGELLRQVPGWSYTEGQKGITRTYRMKDFMAAVRLIDSIAQVAEQEDHHPDLHLTGYRHLRAELSTHSIGGLSMNDFILAAKIDGLPKELKP